MGGRHQFDNLAAALSALCLLNPGCMQRTVEISAAIRSCVVPGRLQKILSSPEVFLDVGHNELAADALATFLVESGRSNITCVLAMLADKSAEKVALAMDHVCRRWLCAGSPGTRGQSGERLAQRLKAVLPVANVSAFDAPGEAMQAALAGADQDETILVFGSFTTVSAAAHWIHHSLKHNAHDADRISTDESVKGT